MRPALLLASVCAGVAFAAIGARAQTPDAPPPSTPPATQPETAAATSPDDPYEALNRRLYDSHNGLDQTFFLPLAKAYHALTPGFIGEALHNMVENLSEPVVITNDLLQGRFTDAAQQTWRLGANSSVGLGGMIDVATPAGAPRQDNDFGITLGRLGVAPGPYLFVPLLGPTTVRDLAGQVVDGFMNPFLYVRFPGRTTLLVTSTVVGGLDMRIRSQSSLDAILEDAADPYATLRSVYLQNREAEIEGSPGVPVLPTMEDEPTAEPSPGDAPPAASPPTPDASAPAATAPDASPPVATPPAAPPPAQAAPGPGASAAPDAPMEPTLDDPAAAPAPTGLAAANQAAHGG